MSNLETCDWCKTSYPTGTYPYWQIMLWGTEKHVICHDCYSHLQPTLKQKVKKSLMRRGIYYLRTGAALMLFPLSLVTAAKTFYPHIDLFFGAILFAVSALATFIGYLWLKKSGFHQSELDVGVEANPYQNDRIVPVQIPLYEGLTELLEKHDIDCSRMKKLLVNSGSKKYGGS